MGVVVDLDVVLLPVAVYCQLSDATFLFCGGCGCVLR